MSVTRRNFLVGLGAGLLPPTAWDFYANYLARTGEPYLKAPHSPLRRLFAADCDDPEGLRLLLDYPSHDASVPDFSQFTKGEFIARYLPSWTDEDLEYEGELDQRVDQQYAFNYWVDAHSPDTKAFAFLQDLNLALTSEDREQGKGWIHFVNSPCPGNCSRWVNTDLLGASILQQKLSELRLPIAVTLP